MFRAAVSFCQTAQEIQETNFAQGEILSAIGWVLGGLFCLTTFASDNPFARTFPASCATVGQLSRYAMLSHSTITPRAEQNGIWPQMRHLIADGLGVPLEMVTPNADFYRDLGAA